MTQRQAPSIRAIGRERLPLFLADEALPDPQRLVLAAQAASFARNGPYYPGIRAAAPAGYAAGLAEALRRPVCAMMGWSADTRLETASCDFSLVTTPPRDLALIQRLPHFDGTDGEVVAVLHYLCGPEHGGTAFYRHRSTGFERVTEDRHAAYDAALRQDLADHGEPGPSYRGASDDIFERHARVECVFNRLIAYSGTTLHSGLVPEGHELSAAPEEGRLTVNTFLRRVSA